jgi:hypothetical protein
VRFKERISDVWINDREGIKSTYGVASRRFGYGDTGTPDADGNILVPSWESCRELFLPRQKDLTHFYYAHTLPRGRGRSFSEFFEKIERRLGIKSTRRTKFQATNKREIVKITPSKFWNKTIVRRSLFTALVRAAEAYRINLENFEESLFSVEYTTDTRWAVRRFLDGCVNYTDPEDEFTGWVSVFEGMRRSEIRKLLVKPKKPRKKKSKKSQPTIAAAA